MNVIDRRMVLAGAVSGLFFALPAAILQRTVFADSAMAGVMVGVIFFAGALAGYGAARPQPPNALAHGALAGVIGSMMALEAIKLISRAGEPLLGVIE